MRRRQRFLTTTKSHCSLAVLFERGIVVVVVVLYHDERKVGSTAAGRKSIVLALAVDPVHLFCV